MLACDGRVTTVWACARSNRIPSAARRSIHGVAARALPYAPNASARSVSIVIRRTLSEGSCRGGRDVARQYKIPPAATRRARRTENRRTAPHPIAVGKRLVWRELEDLRNPCPKHVKVLCKRVLTRFPLEQ